MKPKTTIDTAITDFSSKLFNLQIEELPISNYNKKYLKNYVQNYDFLMSQYAQLLVKAIVKLKKKPEESIFIDYGGGCGILSYLAKHLGFGTVIYNDIYQTSINDTKVIAEALNTTIEAFVPGNVDALVNYVLSKKIKPDLICSFDVLEHIYDLEAWFTEIARLEGPFALLFMTAANPSNVMIANRLKKLHKKVEYQGVERVDGWKEIDLNTSYFEERKKIIKSANKDLSSNEITKLASQSRGLVEKDIIALVAEYSSEKKISYRPSHPSNTCDPYTGNWAERLIDLRKLKKFLKEQNFHVSLTNSYYGYSKNKILNLPKFILNGFIKIMGKENLILSPTYTLEVQKREG